MSGRARQIGVLLWSSVGLGCSAPDPGPLVIVENAGAARRPTEEQVQSALRVRSQSVARCYQRERMNNAVLPRFIYRVEVPVDGSNLRFELLEANPPGRGLLQACLEDALFSDQKAPPHDAGPEGPLVVRHAVNPPTEAAMDRVAKTRYFVGGSSTPQDVEPRSNSPKVDPEVSRAQQRQECQRQCSKYLSGPPYEPKFAKQREQNYQGCLDECVPPAEPFTNP